MRLSQSAMRTFLSWTPRLESMTSFLVCRAYQFLKVPNMCSQALLHGASDVYVLVNIVHTTLILWAHGQLLSGNR